MNLNEGLTKENFWNDMMQQYPSPMKCFCEWIDEYKKAIRWEAMFCDCSNFEPKSENTGSYTKSIKFHDLPYDMQVGIWIRFAEDTLNQLFEQPEYSYSGDLAEDIKTVFKEIDLSEEEV